MIIANILCTSKFCCFNFKFSSYEYELLIDSYMLGHQPNPFYECRLDYNAPALINCAVSLLYLAAFLNNSDLTFSEFHFKQIKNP